MAQVLSPFASYATEVGPEPGLPEAVKLLGEANGAVGTVGKSPRLGCEDLKQQKLGCPRVLVDAYKSDRDGGGSPFGWWTESPNGVCADEVKRIKALTPEELEAAYARDPRYSIGAIPNQITGGSCLFDYKRIPGGRTVAPRTEVTPALDKGEKNALVAEYYYQMKKLETAELVNQQHMTELRSILKRPLVPMGCGDNYLQRTGNWCKAIEANCAPKGGLPELARETKDAIELIQILEDERREAQNRARGDRGTGAHDADKKAASTLGALIQSVKDAYPWMNGSAFKARVDIDSKAIPGRRAPTPAAADVQLAVEDQLKANLTELENQDKEFKTATRCLNWNGQSSRGNPSPCNGNFKKTLASIPDYQYEATKDSKKDRLARDADKQLGFNIGLAQCRERIRAENHERNMIVYPQLVGLALSGAGLVFRVAAKGAQVALAAYEGTESAATLATLGGAATRSAQLLEGISGAYGAYSLGEGGVEVAKQCADAMHQLQQAAPGAANPQQSGASCPAKPSGNNSGYSGPNVMRDWRSCVTNAAMTIAMAAAPAIMAKGGKMLGARMQANKLSRAAAAGQPATSVESAPAAPAPEPGTHANAASEPSQPAVGSGATSTVAAAAAELPNAAGPAQPGGAPEAPPAAQAPAAKDAPKPQPPEPPAKDAPKVTAQAPAPEAPAAKNPQDKAAAVRAKFDKVGRENSTPASRDEGIRKIFADRDLIPENGTAHVIGPGGNFYEWAILLLERKDVHITVSDPLLKSIIDARKSAEGGLASYFGDIFKTIQRDKPALLKPPVSASTEAEFVAQVRSRVEFIGRAETARAPADFVMSRLPHDYLGDFDRNALATRIRDATKPGGVAWVMPDPRMTPADFTTIGVPRESVAMLPRNPYSDFLPERGSTGPRELFSPDKEKTATGSTLGMDHASDSFVFVKSDGSKAVASSAGGSGLPSAGSERPAGGPASVRDFSTPRRPNKAANGDLPIPASKGRQFSFGAAKDAAGKPMQGAYDALAQILDNVDSMSPDEIKSVIGKAAAYKEFHQYELSKAMKEKPAGWADQTVERQKAMLFYSTLEKELPAFLGKDGQRVTAAQRWNALSDNERKMFLEAGIRPPAGASAGGARVPAANATATGGAGAVAAPQGQAPLPPAPEFPAKGKNITQPTLDWALRDDVRANPEGALRALEQRYAAPIAEANAIENTPPENRTPAQKDRLVELRSGELHFVKEARKYLAMKVEDVRALTTHGPSGVDDTTAMMNQGIRDAVMNPSAKAVARNSSPTFSDAASLKQSESLLSSLKATEPGAVPGAKRALSESDRTAILWARRANPEVAARMLQKAGFSETEIQALTKNGIVGVSLPAAQ